MVNFYSKFLNDDQDLASLGDVVGNNMHSSMHLRERDCL